MAERRRPSYLNLVNDDISDQQPPTSASSSKPSFQMDLPSPRVGEVPPAMSPLDAMIAQSRLLARRFEQPAENGKRISRLPYSDVARELANRPDYFRGIKTSPSGGMEDVPEGKEETSPIGLQVMGNVVTGGNERDRPMSHYPMFGNAARPEHARQMSQLSQQSGLTPFYDAEDDLTTSQPQDYFAIGVPRATSPEPVDQKTVNVQAATPTNIPSLTNSVDSIQSAQTPLQNRTAANGSTQAKRSLAPPRSPAYPKSPRSFQSIRSVPADSGDEDGSVNSSQPVSSSRKFSGSSGMSRPQSPFSPFMPPMPRSPSMSSDFSVSGSQRRMNFSRPLSSNSNRPPPEPRRSLESRSSFETRPSGEYQHHQRDPSGTSTSTLPSSGVPSRQASQDDAVTADDMPAVPGAFIDDDETGSRPTTSYTYAKFTLPRGHKVERTSRGTRESWIQRQFTWDDATAGQREQAKKEEMEQLDEAPTQRPSAESIPAESMPSPLPSPAFQPLPPSAPPTPLDPPSDLPLQPPPPLDQPASRPASPAGSERMFSDRHDRANRNRSFSSTTRSRSAEPSTLQKAAALHKSSPSIRTHATSSTDRTIRPSPLHDRSPSAELTAEEHLEIGIETHSNGELSKSTYHLRIAAREGSATGMLLYALACRHGWGMRPNQAEGVAWLKKAIDSAGLQVADVEATLATANRSGANIDPVVEALERKKRKAQFALAIYELGISYMNGWGCAKDKPLALQCYEVAGSWGDCDALAEAGFCYAQGQGCKKDVKRAAALYRRAAEGGMSMAGNSW